MIKRQLVPRADIVGMLVRDIRLAGFQYYYGQNDEGIAPFDDLKYVTGLTNVESLYDSHDPIIVVRNQLGYIPEDETNGQQTHPDIIINIFAVIGFILFTETLIKNDDQNHFKKYRVTYWCITDGV